MTSFSSKILLFGEHIINKGAEALAIPYPNFFAELSFDKNKELFLEASSVVLDKILAHIKQNSLLLNNFDVPALESDMEKGIGFLLNIPVGYGLGSSGAIVACLFDRYAINKNWSPKDLKLILGEVESVFHGKSSGLDPLVSYLNKAVHISKETRIVEHNLNWKDSFEIFLVDTNKARKTAPLVEAFLQKSDTDAEFSKVLHQEIIPCNNLIIKNFLENKHDNTLGQLKDLSLLQFKYMNELILEEHKDLWRKGFETKDYFLKICGAGGGGFMLGFSRSKQVELPFNVLWID